MTELPNTFGRFLAGDDAAFAELYREVNPPLSAYCHTLTPGNAEDLMQELWERVIAMRNRPNPAAPREVASPLAFLFRMLKNLAIDEHRRCKSEMLREGDETVLTERSDGTYEEQQSSSLEAIILEAFAKLGDEDKEILALNIYSGYKFGEIAEMLGLTNDAVWQRASRPRVRMRKIVELEACRTGVALPALQKSARKKEIV